jgi:cellulose biosynthesis protein BcsQ
MLAISVFNNKGGVGKTTLTCNLASFFALQMRLRVLIIDCDPQCNSTQLMMGEDFATDLYWEGTNTDHTTTIRDILQPIEDGDSKINEKIVPVLGSKNRFGVDLIPGHPSFSVIEDRLGAAWHDLRGGDLGGIRKTNWNTSLRAALDGRYDVVFYDLGPSLGSINRSVLIGCNRFMTPMGADIFSILGIRNIAHWLQQWATAYSNGLDVCEQNTPGRLAEYPVARTAEILHGFAGYTMQQYITKSKSGVRRPTKAYEDIINSVPRQIEQSLGPLFAPGIDEASAKLGDVPHLYSLIPLAQSVSAPILSLTGADGLVGSQFQQRVQYGEILSAIARRLADNLGILAA